MSPGPVRESRESATPVETPAATRPADEVPGPPVARSTQAQATCPACGARIPGHAPEGLCPRCLLASSLATDASPLRGGPGRFTVPSVEELGALLPGFEIEGLLGRGGMGVVYRARDRRLDRPVALKVLPAELAADPAAEARFEREGRALAKLAHPFIVHLHDFGEAGPYFYLVLELVSGRDLRAVMRSEGRAPQGEALRWGARLCEALEWAHGQGVVHRDIKPENIIIDAQGSPRLADFGLAKLVGLDEVAGAPSLTGTHQLLGSPHYMPPEQLGGGLVDARTDIYALGAVLYELLTGTLPLGRFPLPSETSGVDPSLDAIVLRCLARDPPGRYPDAASLRRDLEVARERLDPAYRRDVPLQRLASAAGKAAGALSRRAARPSTRVDRGLAILSAISTLVALGATTQPLGYAYSSSYYHRYSSSFWMWEDQVGLPTAFSPLWLLAAAALAFFIRPLRALAPLPAIASVVFTFVIFSSISVTDAGALYLGCALFTTALLCVLAVRSVIDGHAGRSAPDVAPAAAPEAASPAAPTVAA